MQIGGRWRLENRGPKSIVLLNSLKKLASLQMERCPSPVVVSAGKREVSIVVVSYHWATSKLSDICCPFKVGQSFTGPKAVCSHSSTGPPPHHLSAATTVASKRGTNTRVPVVNISCDITPSILPNVHTGSKKVARKSASPPAQTKKTDPLCSPLPVLALRGWWYMIHPPLKTQTARYPLISRSFILYLLLAENNKNKKQFSNYIPMYLLILS